MPPPKKPRAPGDQEIEFENPHRITLKQTSIRIKAGLELKRVSPSSFVVLRKKKPLAQFTCTCNGGEGTCRTRQIDPDILRCIADGPEPCVKGVCVFRANKSRDLPIGELIEMKVKPF